MAAFVNKPTSRKELEQLIGQLEEKSVVAEERMRQEVEARPSEAVKDSSPSAFRGGLRRPGEGISTQCRCWTCGIGHVSRNCPRKVAPAGKTGEGPAPKGALGKYVILS
jgi:hypothetical protein